jgi:hypothetical protein
VCVAIASATCLLPLDRAQGQIESPESLLTIEGCVNRASGRLRFAVPTAPCTTAEKSIEWPQLQDVAPANLVRGCVEPSSGALALFRWRGPLGVPSAPGTIGPPPCDPGLLAFDWAVLVVGGDENEIRVCANRQGRARVVGRIEPCRPNEIFDQLAAAR